MEAIYKFHGVSQFGLPGTNGVGSSPFSCTQWRWWSAPEHETNVATGQHPPPALPIVREAQLTSLSLSFSRKCRATWLGKMFRSMFSLCSLSSFISLISSLACTRQRKSKRAVYSSCSEEEEKKTYKLLEDAVCSTKVWGGGKASLERFTPELQPDESTMGGSMLAADSRSTTTFRGMCPSPPEVAAPVILWQAVWLSDTTCFLY